jgi:7-cyano-7-deazaguanine synthase
MIKKAVCIFSGGLDSTCTLAYIKNKGYQVYTLTFKYGQRNKYEINIAKSLIDIIGVNDYKIIDISFMKELYKESKSALISNTDNKIGIIFDYSIVVPVRNAIFISMASAYAFSINADLVVYGSHKDDSIYYPDCRIEFIKNLENALNLGEIDGINQGIRNRIEIWSPTIDNLNKLDLVKIGYKLLGDNIFKSWSCYNNGVLVNNERIHCGVCKACVDRKIAFLKSNIIDKTIYFK